MTTSSKTLRSKSTVAVVSGANKGIGYEIVRGLADQGLTVVLTARDPAKGKAALDALKADGQNSILFHPLDLSSSTSIETLAVWLENQFGGIDILVNNAAIVAGPAGFAFTYENAKAIIDNNYCGAKNVTKRLLPLLRASPAGARIVNCVSRAGFYSRFRSETLKQKFADEDNYSEELADSLATKYLDDIKAGRWEEEGWIIGGADNAPIYSESKIFLIVFFKALAKRLSESQPEDHKILVTSFCPGAVRTDMMSTLIAQGLSTLSPGFGLKNPADGADTGLWLALLPKEELTPKNGKLFGEREEYAFGLENQVENSQVEDRTNVSDWKANDLSV